MKNFIFETLDGEICFAYILNDKQIAVDLKTGKCRPIDHWGSIWQRRWDTGVYEAYKQLFTWNRRKFIRKLKKGKTCWVNKK